MEFNYFNYLNILLLLVSVSKILKTSSFFIPAEISVGLSVLYKSTEQCKLTTRLKLRFRGSFRLVPTVVSVITTST